MQNLSLWSIAGNKCSAHKYRGKSKVGKEQGIRNLFLSMPDAAFGFITTILQGQHSV